jgi:hypothetical protein
VKSLGIEVWIIAAGILLLFIGDKLAGIGNSVDSVVASKWTAISLIAIGGGVIAYHKFK